MNEKTKAAFVALQSKYMTTFAEKIPQIRAAIANQQVSIVQQEFHKLKGSGKTYGFAAISEVAKFIDQHCKAHHPEALIKAEKACQLLEKIAQAFPQQQTYDIQNDPLLKEIQ